MEFLASVLDFILLFRGVGDAVMSKKEKKKNQWGLHGKHEGADA